MKVLWISHLLPYPPRGGVLQRSYNLLKELSKGNEIYLIAFNQKALMPTSDQIREAVDKLKEICCNVDVLPLFSDKNKLNKLFLILISLFTQKPYTVNWNRSRLLAKMVNESVSHFKPEAIHYDTIGLAEYFQEKKSIVQFLNHHNIESAMMFRRAKKVTNIFKKLYFYQEAWKLSGYEKKVINKFCCNFTVSEEDEATLKRINPTCRTSVIANGVDTSYFYNDSKRIPSETLIFAGGMRWYPNKDAMLFFTKDIWPLIKKQKPHIKMVLIGKYPPRSLIEISQSDENFIIKGFVEDVRPYFAESMVYVCPIRDGGGTRLKILDALSFGIPIVATSVGAEGIKVTHGKNILIADEPEDFAAQVVKLIDDGKLRGTLSREGRLLAEGVYSWSIIGKKFRNLYSSLA